ncbi:hypothetical protein V2J09_000753 [Rumex salicifolius]
MGCGTHHVAEAQGTANGEHARGEACGQMDRLIFEHMLNDRLLQVVNIDLLDVKIQGHVIYPDKQRAAAKMVGAENAKLALSLAEYDEELKVLCRNIMYMAN